MAEQLVRDSGFAWRILRPSIVMGHSVTRRSSSDSGVYSSVSQLMELSGRARVESIELVQAADATLDLVPIDQVVDEIVALMGGRREDHRSNVSPDAR